MFPSETSRPTDITEENDHVRPVVARLLIQERTVYKRSFHQRTNNRKNESDSVIQPSWRKTILVWMYGLTAKCDILSKETIAVAAYYLDVSISQGLVESQLDFKVVSIACLSIATKIVDSASISLKELMILCRGQFSVIDVATTELRILTTLQWRLHPPTPNCFIHQFLRLFPNDIDHQTLDKVRQISQLLIELSTCCQPLNCSQSLPSELAFASILLATELVGPGKDMTIRNRHVWCIRMRTHCKLKCHDFSIRKVIRELGSLVTEDEESATRLCELVGKTSEQQNHRFPTSDKSASWPSPNYQNLMKLSPRSPVSFPAEILLEPQYQHVRKV